MEPSLGGGGGGPPPGGAAKAMLAEIMATHAIDSRGSFLILILSTRSPLR